MGRGTGEGRKEQNLWEEGGRLSEGWKFLKAETQDCGEGDTE